MNDEIRQVREGLFDRTIFGLALLGLAAALVIWVVSGFSSPWFLYAVALVVVALVAFGLRQAGRLVVAAYVLVLELIGLVAGIFLQTNTVAGFAPYLFILVVVISGLVLRPIATPAVGAISIFTTVAIAALNQQLTSANLVTLLLPFGLIILTTLLVAEGKRHLDRLDSRLLESGELLRIRTREMMETQEKVARLQARAAGLEQQLSAVQGESDQVRRMAAQKSQGLYELMKGTLQELSRSVKALERINDSLSNPLSADEQANLLEQAWQRIIYLTNLTINLEEMVRLENNEIELDYQTIDVARMIREATGTAQGLARSKHLEVRCQVAQDLPALQADPMRLRQVLLQVLSNAVKYTDQGIVEVQAELTNRKELMIFVSDTGIGMHREEMDLVFRKFGRGSGTLARQRQGSGLGLAISRRLIELHGGRMWVTSVLGVGSTFYITLPLEPASPPVPALTRPAPPAVRPAEVAAPPRVSMPVAEPQPAALSTDEDRTLLSTRPVTTLPAQPRPHSGPPVSRFGPSYIVRFGLILLGLLLVIVVCVAFLAIRYGSAGDAEEPVTAGSPSPPVTASELSSKTGPTEEQAGLISIATPSPAATSLPSAAPTSLPTEPPPPAPTDTPAVSATATSTSMPTPAPPPPTAIPTQTPTNTPEPGKVEVVTVTVVPVTVTPGTQRLSFIVEQAGNQSIMLRPPGGGPNARLEVAVKVVADSNLSWSPDGRRVLFTTDRDGDREIYVANADGSPPVRLTQADGDDTQPSWSPDGRRIAFSSGRSGNFDIYVMDAGGSNPVQLTTSRGFDEWPVWSPDGTKIAFVSDRAGNVEIYTINIDGSNERRITNHPADDWPVSWSPDGRKLLFASNRDVNWNLYLAGADGGDARRLTNDPADEREPVWSPDGRTIAFAANGNGNWDIYTMPAPVGLATETPRSAWVQITNTPADERYPTWLP